MSYRLVFIAPRFHTNQFVLTKSLIELDNDVRFYVTKSEHSENHTYIKPIMINYSSRYNIPSIKRIVDIIKYKPNFIILRDVNFINFILSHLFKLFKLNVILYIQMPIYSPISKKLPAIIVQSISRKVFTPVLGNASEFKRINNNWQYVPFIAENKIDFLNRRYFVDDCINLLVVAKFSRRKKILDLIRVYEKIHISIIQTRLTIVGTINDQKYYEEVLEYTRNTGIKVIVNVPHEEMSDLYLNNDVFVLPSVNEPASYSQLEAMAHGMAIIISSDNGTSNYVKNDYNGYIFSTSNFDLNLYSCMISLLENREKILSFAANSLRIIEENHSINNFTRFLDKNVKGKKNVQGK